MLPFLLISLSTIFDTNPTIVGKVVDEKGSPVSFAKVGAGGSTTLTDINGFFSLEVKSDSVFIDALSFEKIKIPVSNFTNPVVLEPAKPRNIRTLK